MIREIRKAWELGSPEQRASVVVSLTSAGISVLMAVFAYLVLAMVRGR